MNNPTTKLPSFKEFLKSRDKGGAKKGVNLLAALKKAKLAKKSGEKESATDTTEEKKEKGDEESKENT
jgi:hypothetical protein